ncbi:hypothetical protein ACFLT7_00605 [candidate division KSB1 bacterium]
MQYQYIINRVVERKNQAVKIPTLKVLFRMGMVLFLMLSGSSNVNAANKIFLVRTTGHTLDDFRTYAELAARLKPYGRVQIVISSLSDKSWYEFPEGGSPWHEYACYVSAPWKFYPHPKIAPFIPAASVTANRKLMLARASVVRELGLEAVFYGKNSNMLPEAFFRKYPHLRGPRVDHPRRSKAEAFAWCVDLPETQEMIEWMMAEIVRNVPEIKTVTTGTNDAGSGLCWAAALYSGPNGPAHCQHINAGERVRDLSLAVHRGAEMGGGDVRMIWSSANFWQGEDVMIRAMLPEDTYMRRGDRSFMGVGTMINSAYPFLGLIDPLAVIGSMERYHRPGIENFSLGFSAMYGRADDRPESISKLIDLVENCIAEPTDGIIERLEKLKKIAGIWAGKQNEEKVFQAFYDLHEAFSLKRAVAGEFAAYSNYYCGVSMRHLTRPLVIKPELLTPEEESYFLPHIFSIDENEARTDYIEFNGGRMIGTARWNNSTLRRALGMAIRAGDVLENLEDAPEKEWLRDLGISLKMWASEVRSIHNFYHAQLIRDKFADILDGEPRLPAKVASWTGDPGNLEWNEIQRDELDNTNELIALLERGGQKLVACADDPRYEDTFLVGPDLIDQLKKKAAIMRAHWLDVQIYLATPLK